MTTVRINSVTINSTSGSGHGPFYTKDTITSVDLGNAPWTNNSMEMAFQHCAALTTVTNINNNITRMYWTFYYCSSLTTVPIIPNSVTDMETTFGHCHNLINAPAIPNSVINIPGTFQYCRNLTTIPTIPAAVTDMRSTFAECVNLTGNIFIESNQISRASSCFYNTTLPKNVYIPFTYSNGVNTQTYNSFTSAGYKTDGSKEGVYLKDIGSL